MRIRKEPIPVLKPFGGKEELAQLGEVFESGWWTRGPKVEEFENRFADMVGAKYALAVTSNSHGIDLVMKACGIRHKDVINPTISFAATAMLPLWNDCTSNIVDIDRDTLNIDPTDTLLSMKMDTACIIVVDMAGILAPIKELRKFYNGLIIEDAAHACYTKGAGRDADVTVWSFHAVKTLPTGDGGMITTDDGDLYEKLSSMTWFGVTSTRDREKGKSYSWDYDVENIGYKYYMNDITAAIGLAQLEKLPRHLERRRQIQQRYNEKLADYIGRPQWSETCQYYCARVHQDYRDDLIDYLSDKNVHASVHFKPLHLHPFFKQNRVYPVADEEWKKLITLPCHPGLTDEDVDYIVYWIQRFVDERAIQSD